MSSPRYQILVRFLKRFCHALVMVVPVLAQAQTESPQTELPEWTNKRRPALFKKQGFPREQARSLLDPQVRDLLDALLDAYRQPGLFIDRKKLLLALKVYSVNRRWNVDDPVSGRREFIDTFAKSGLFARPAWVGEYRYTSNPNSVVGQWHAVASIRVNEKLECIDSRAVEGYFDLVLDPGLDGHAHPVPERINRHGVFGHPAAPPLAVDLPQLSMIFSSGCLVGLDVARIFSRREVPDDRIHN